MLPKLVALVSLLLAASLSCADLASEAAAAKTQAEFQRVLAAHKGDPLADAVSSDYPGQEWKDGQQAIAGRARIGALVEGKQAPPQTGDAKSPSATQAKAKEILKNPLYRDAEVVEKKSWLEDALERFFDWLSKFFQPKARQDRVAMPMLPFVQVVVWAVIILAVLAFLVFVAKQLLQAKRRDRKKLGGLLDDDEPELAADEWLEKAAKLEAEGRFREAVRCLYLACLMRLDESGRIRFVRHQTNWEHLHRLLDKSGASGQVMRPATQLFDHVWYGHEPATKENVAAMRGHYASVVEDIKTTRQPA